MINFKGIILWIGELGLFIGNGIFIHIHLKSFDKIFGIGVSDEGFFIGADPVITFKKREVREFKFKQR
ncbi:MAG: hypothetical protein DRN92_02590 [Thermoproteota archaeon]|nr:MAG: hypothetical protein DRN92_02590 [Candidatus Korarchaeota archaeon]